MGQVPSALVWALHFDCSKQTSPSFPSSLFSRYLYVVDAAQAGPPQATPYRYETDSEGLLPLSKRATLQENIQHGN